jgi:hypothetical protein
MFQIIYDPTLINSLISIAYCGKDELLKNDMTTIQKYLDITYFSYPFDNFCPIILGKDKQFLFYLTFDKIKQKWLFYHANKDWLVGSITHKILNILSSNFFPDILIPDTSVNHFGIFIDDCIEILQSSNKNGKSVPYTFCYCYADFKENIIYKKIYVQDQRFPEYKTFPLNNYSDMIIPVNGAIVHLNPPTFVDLVFTTLKLVNGLEKTNEVIEILLSQIYLENTVAAFSDFETSFNNIQEINPKPEYNQIYQLFNKYDKEYYDTKMKCFHNEVLKMFSESKIIFDPKNIRRDSIGGFIANFINLLGQDIALELCIIYHRFKHFPMERVKLYQKYPNHPYIILIKLIYNSYFKNKKTVKKYISPEEILQIIRNNQNTDSHNYLISILIEGIRRRSELFVFMYSLFLDTSAKKIKPKYKTKYNYFPFKIFSSRLFIMEHMLLNN